MSVIEIRSARDDDTQQICDIYNHYVLTSTITFEETPVMPFEMAERIREVQASSLPWLVAVDGGAVQGFTYAHKWKIRAAYRHSFEVTIYVREGLNAKGIGSQLYRRLFELLKLAGAHAVIGGIALPNEASLRLHQKLGFEKVAHFKDVGFKFGRWVDVSYWQIILNA